MSLQATLNSARYRLEEIHARLVLISRGVSTGEKPAADLANQVKLIQADLAACSAHIALLTSSVQAAADSVLAQLGLGRPVPKSSACDAEIDRIFGAVAVGVAGAQPANGQTPREKSRTPAAS